MSIRIVKRVWFGVAAGAVLAAGCGKSSDETASAPSGQRVVVTDGGSAYVVSDAKAWKDGRPVAPPVQAVTPPPADGPAARTSAEAMTQRACCLIDADQFFNKRVEVVGVTVPVGPMAAPAWKVKVALAGAMPVFSTTRCDVVCKPVAAAEATAKALPAGRKVRAVGTVVGYGYIGIDLNDCELTDLGPADVPPPVRPADEVLAAFAADPAAAAAKYTLVDGTPAVFTLSGVAADVEAVPDPQHKDRQGGTVRLKGPDGASVVVAVVYGNMKYIRAGQKVRVGGLFDGYDPATKTLKLKTGTAV